MEAKDLMSQLEHSRRDASANAATDTAWPLAEFYKVLRDAEMDEHTRSQLTLMYGRRILTGKVG